MYIHANIEDWWPLCLKTLSEDYIVPVDKINQCAEKAIAEGDTVKYVQLGDPESIIITNEEIHTSEERRAEAAELSL